jgi:transketolase
VQTTIKYSSSDYKKMANAIRSLSMDAVEKAKSGHPGMPMGMADVATILFSEFLQFDPKNPSWSNRDRFVLSTGHGSMLLYSLLYLTGYEDITIEDIKNFRQLGAKTAGHPEYGFLKGIETTTGPLGQGIANAVGMALGGKILADNFGNNIINHKIYTIVGDGCLMEGISHEASSFAGHLKLNNLVVLFDDNQISIDGPTSLSVSENTLMRYRSYGWFVQQIDGHNYDEIRQAIAAANASSLPSIIACKTTIGYGAPTKAGTSSCHGSPLGEKEIQGAKENLDWQYEPFVIPEDVLKLWNNIGKKGAEKFSNWQNEFAKTDKEMQKEFTRISNKELPNNWRDAIAQIKLEFAKNPIADATRKSSGRVLEKLAEFIPEILGGSADLTGSNDTKNKCLVPISPENYQGRYIYYGVREHAMAAIMNGLALYSGFVPYGGTFLVFTDYCRPAIRLSALMGLKVIYVMTHDSIGLGEDGPTHQPVEHLASLRAIPNLLVLRPADAQETAECWEIAIEQEKTPSILALSRQNLDAIRVEYNTNNLCKKGAYVISKTNLEEKVLLFASGSEVEIAIHAQAILADQNIGASVVSVPCIELFWQQDYEYIAPFICNNKIKVAIEAGCSMGWDKIIGPHGIFIGMSSFGESAPYKELYSHFGITAENIMFKILEKMKG